MAQLTLFSARMVSPFQSRLDFAFLLLGAPVRLLQDKHSRGFADANPDVQQGLMGPGGEEKET